MFVELDLKEKWQNFMHLELIIVFQGERAAYEKKNQTIEIQLKNKTVNSKMYPPLSLP